MEVFPSNVLQKRRRCAGICPAPLPINPSASKRPRHDASPSSPSTYKECFWIQSQLLCKGLSTTIKFWKFLTDKVEVCLNANYKHANKSRHWHVDFFPHDRNKTHLAQDLRGMQMKVWRQAKPFLRQSRDIFPNLKKEASFVIFAARNSLSMQKFSVINIGTVLLV